MMMKRTEEETSDEDEDEEDETTTRHGGKGKMMMKRTEEETSHEQEQPEKRRRINPPPAVVSYTDTTSHTLAYSHSDEESSSDEEEDERRDRCAQEILETTLTAITHNPTLITQHIPTQLKHILKHTHTQIAQHIAHILILTLPQYRHGGTLTQHNITHTHVQRHTFTQIGIPYTPQNTLHNLNTLTKILTLHHHIAQT